MLLVRIALTTLTNQVRMRDLMQVAAALQTQITRDFTPIWGVTAMVVAAPFEAMPFGYIPVIVQETRDTHEANGFHRVRDDDSPYVVIPYGPLWSLAASHEIMCMLVDPSGSARAPGQSPLPGQGSVEYMTDVCAPCQDIDSAYLIDGVAVSGFCRPAFYGVGPCSGGLSFTGVLKRPFEPAAGGVVTWFADDGLLYQARAANGRIAVHGGFSPASRGRLLLREFVGSLTPTRLARLSNARLTGAMADADQNARRARLSNMLRFREELTWRYGDAAASQPLQPAMTAALSESASRGYARSGQQRASTEPATTERTAS